MPHHRHPAPPSPYASRVHDALSPLRVVVEAFPAPVTDLLWDLSPTPFMDLAGLHLLFSPPLPRRTVLSTPVTGLHAQPLRLLLLATDPHPRAFDLSRLLPGTPATALGGRTNHCASPMPGEPNRSGCRGSHVRRR